MSNRVRLGDRVFVNTPSHLYERKVGTVYAATGKGSNTRYVIEWEISLDEHTAHHPSYTAHQIRTAR